MDRQVCVNCLNKKAVNTTTNRLVTESCGHVKCMDCLLKEKNGCEACARQEKTVLTGASPDDPLLSEDIVIPKEKEEVINGHTINEECQQASDLNKKKKPETSHIKVEEVDGNVKYYMCTVCKKKFHARSQVAYHAYCNGQRKPYQCPECNKSFATHSHFKYHMRVHRNERTYACELCGDSFFQMSKLQRHKLKHTKEKKFACAQCGAAFNNVSSLRKHARTHADERPHVCDVCARAFRDSSNYRKHVANHDVNSAGRPSQQSQRAFQCPRCPQAFRNKKDMRRHAAVHTDSKPFRCKVCDRRFRRKDNLERHIRNTHRDHVTSSAIDYDEGALTDPFDAEQTTDKNNEEAEKTRLEILNPLPPLSPDVIKRHLELKLGKETNGSINKNASMEQSYILEANIARQSVIFGPINKKDKKEYREEHEYVHKIKKPNCWASQKDLSLPPVDQKKIIELNEKTCSNNLDMGMPGKNLEVYKKILYLERPDDSKDHDNGEKDNTSPEMHWKRRMTFNIY